MRFLVVIFLASAVLVTAWLPREHKNITTSDGTNLFYSSPSYTYDSPQSVTGRRATKRWLPASGKIRGVNLGSMFVFEPWIAESEWSSMGCGPYKSEFDCVSGLGQAAANSAFQKHWGSWITQTDLDLMQSYGLNTIRIPVGYWMREDIVYSDSEHFPQGGFAYLEQLCGWASDRGFYIIIDLHGAPGAQVASNPFTGQYAPSPGFYVDWQFERALEFLGWMTTKIHSSSNFRNVGMLEIVNEPVQNPDEVGAMRSSYYPNAISCIRDAEKALGIQPNNFLHIQMMNSLWGSGDPAQYINDSFTAYDDHRYLKWAGTPASHSSYINTSCSDNRGGDGPTIVGEFSLSVPDDVQWTPDWDPSKQQAFYKQWFAAQTMAYEKQIGWIFWSWKSQLGDYRWAYQDAVTAGVIPTNLNSVYNVGAC